MFAQDLLGEHLVARFQTARTIARVEPDPESAALAEVP